MPVVAAIFWAGAFSALWATIMHLSGALGFTFFLVLPLLIWWLVDRALATEQQQNIADVIVPSALASGIYIGAVLDLLGRSLGAEMGSGAEDSMSSVQGFLIIAIFLTVAGGVFVYFHVKSAEKRRGERF